MKHIGQYRVEAFPTSILATFDIGIASKMKHHIKALIELDVTEARKMIREKKKQNRNISFNSWLIKCISSIIKKPGAIDDKIDIREYLYMTVSVDHDASFYNYN
jgi:hypothetical protein